jgi:hypothetical protein
LTELRAQKSSSVFEGIRRRPLGLRPDQDSGADVDKIADLENVICSSETISRHPELAARKMSFLIAVALLLAGSLGGVLTMHF